MTTDTLTPLHLQVVELYECSRENLYNFHCGKIFEIGSCCGKERVRYRCLDLATSLGFSYQAAVSSEN